MHKRPSRFSGQPLGTFRTAGNMSVQGHGAFGDYPGTAFHHVQTESPDQKVTFLFQNSPGNFNARILQDFRGNSLVTGIGIFRTVNYSLETVFYNGFRTRGSFSRRAARFQCNVKGGIRKQPDIAFGNTVGNGISFCMGRPAFS